MGMLSADTEIMMTVRLINAEYQGSHALLCHSYVATLVKSLSSCVGQSVGLDYKAFQTLQPNVPYRGLYINLM